MDYHFEWDAAKAKRNLAKHRVAFEQATELFADPLAVSVYDDEHSEREERWVTLARTLSGQLLVVVHTFEEHADAATVRIISARHATPHEATAYEGH